MPYIFILLINGLLLALSNSLKIKYFYYLAAISLIIFSGMRISGMDYESYNFIYDSIKSNNYQEYIDPINLAIIKLGFIISDSNKIIFLIYSAITVFSVIFFIDRNSSNKELSLYIFMTFGLYYLSTFNIIRQWLAIAILLIGFNFLLEKKYLYLYFIICIASIIHLSALIFIFMPFFNRRYKLKNLLFILIMSPVLIYLIFQLIGISSYVHYLNEDFIFTADDPILRPTTLFYLLFNIFIVWKLKYFQKAHHLDEKIIIFLNMCIASSLIIILFYFMGFDFQILMRANVYFTIQYIILIPILIRILSKKHNYIFNYVFIVLLSLNFIFSIYFNGESQKLLPYN